MGAVIKSGKINPETGMTLLETVVSLVILVLIAVTFLSVFTVTHSSIASAGYRTSAASHAEAVIESIRANSALLAGPVFSSHALPATYADDSQTGADFLIPELGVTVPDPGHFREKVVIDRFEPGNVNLFRVAVTVSWKEQGAFRSVTLTSVVAAR